MNSKLLIFLKITRSITEAIRIALVWDMNTRGQEIQPEVSSTEFNATATIKLSLHLYQLFAHLSISHPRRCPRESGCSCGEDQVLVSSRQFLCVSVLSLIVNST